jgi:hypothetical protein
VIKKNFIFATIALIYASYGHTASSVSESCPKGQVYSNPLNQEGKGGCCPSEQDWNADGKDCCKRGSVYSNPTGKLGDGGCCAPGMINASTGKPGKDVCCQKQNYNPITNTCCPKNQFYSNPGGKGAQGDCCKEGYGYDSTTHRCIACKKNSYNLATSTCCPGGVENLYNPITKTCCPSGKVFAKFAGKGLAGCCTEQLPQGYYQQSCSDCCFDNNILTCRCRASDGSIKQTSLAVSGNNPIYNVNGGLEQLNRANHCGPGKYNPQTNSCCPSGCLYWNYNSGCIKPDGSPCGAIVY